VKVVKSEATTDSLQARLRRHLNGDDVMERGLVSNTPITTASGKCHTRPSAVTASSATTQLLICY